MSNFELSDIAGELVRLALYDTIKTLTNSVVDRVKIVPKVLAENGCGIVCRVTFTATNGSSSPLSSSLILKVAAQNLMRRSYTYARPCFLREIFVYDEILPYFRKFEQSKGINVDADGFNAYPQCYRTLDTDQNECLLLEDLDKRGFTMLNSSSRETTVDHVRLFVNSLAKFHAISFAIANQQPEKFKQLTSNLDDIYLVKENVTAEHFFAAQADNFLKFFSAPNDAHLYQKLKEFFANGAFNVGLEVMERQSSESAKVIGYGDAYQNNTLFRHDSNGNPAEICFIDMQMSRYASPVIDLIYFIFTSTTKQMRDIHYEYLLKTYHDQLSAHIRRLGSDPEKLFSYATFQRHLKLYARIVLMWAPVVTSHIFTNYEKNWDDLVENYKQSQEVPKSLLPHTDDVAEKVNKRLRDIATDMIRLGYI